MKRILSFVTKYPWYFLLAIFIITIVSAWQIRGLKVSISAESMYVKNSAAWQVYQDMVETFGQDGVTVVYLGDPSLFDPDKLSAIHKAVDAIESLPFVIKTSSLYSVRNIKIQDDYVTSEPYLEPYIGKKTASIEETLHSVKEAQKNPLVAGNLISNDGKAMAINVYLKSDTGYHGFDEEVTLAIERSIAPLRGNLETVFQIGAPYIRKALTDRVLIDQQYVLPLALVVLILTLALSLRRLSSAIIPLLTAVLSIVWTLGLMAWLEIPLNIITSIVPALLVIIGSTEDIHLLAEYSAGIRKGMSRTAAVDYMSVNMGNAVFLTSVTTYLGFLSIYFNSIDILKQFGFIASTGLMLNFVATIIVVPITLRYFGHQKNAASQANIEGFVPSTMSALYRLIRLNKRAAFALTVITVLVFGYGSLSMHVNNNPMDYFGKESAINTQAQILHDRLAGLHTFSIVIDSRIEETFLQVRYLEELQKIQDYLGNTGLFDYTVSFANLMGLVNSVMAEEDGEQELPETDDLVREYMLLLKRKDVKELVSPDFDKARILVRHNIGSSFELSQAIQELRDFITRELDPALRVDITGYSILANHAADSMAFGQAQSLGLMVGAIFIIVSILFLSIKAGLLAVLPNLVPIVALFGVMGYLGIPLDTGTSMVAAIAMGVCVDDTMHFMSRYRQEMTAYKDEDLALLNTIRKESIPIFSTSVALALGFATFAISSFSPVMNFGLLSAMVIILALLATFLIMPSLLHTVPLLTLWDIISTRLERDSIERCELLRGIKPHQVKRILLVGEILEYKQGETIIRQGETDKKLFVLLEGKADVRKQFDDGTTHQLRSLETGSVFGEIALVVSCSRTANVVASEPSRILALRWEHIKRLSRFFPHISTKIHHNLSSILGSRLAVTDEVDNVRKDYSTGMLTRAYFLDHLQLAFARVRRYQEPTTLILLGIFRKSGTSELNNALLLSDIFNSLSAEYLRLRDVDVVGGWSKNRIILLLPQTPISNVGKIWERLPKILPQESLKDEAYYKLKASVAQIQGEDAPNALIERMNHALDATGYDENDLVFVTRSLPTG